MGWIFFFFLITVFLQCFPIPIVTAIPWTTKYDDDDDNLPCGIQSSLAIFYNTTTWWVKILFAVQNWFIVTLN